MLVQYNLSISAGAERKKKNYLCIALFATVMWIRIRMDPHFVRALGSGSTVDGKNRKKFKYFLFKFKMVPVSSIFSNINRYCEKSLKTYRYCVAYNEHPNFGMVEYGNR